MKDDEARIAAYYDRLVLEYGHSPRACDAPSRFALEVRYRALADVMDLSGMSVLEVGCGFGQLGAYLQQRYKEVDYAGIDISARMIEEGHRLYPHLSLDKANILEMDSSRQFDVVLAQGLFYLLGENAEAKTEELIMRMFCLARHAVAFSAISAWAPSQSDAEYYADPVHLLMFCHRLTPRLVLRHDYHQGDLTMYLYK